MSKLDLRKAVFHSDMLPGGLTSKQRARAWADVVTPGSGRDVDCPIPEGFSAQGEFLALPDVAVARAMATSIRVVRSSKHVSTDSKPGVMLLLNDGVRPLHGDQAGREHALREGDGAVLDDAAPHVSGAPRGGRALTLQISRSAFEQLPNAERLLGGSVIDHRVEAMQLLRGYLRLMMNGHRPITEAVATASSRHVLELVSLALGGARPERDAADDIDGECAARIALLMDEINRRSAEPGLSPSEVGKVLGLSERTVQSLLQRAGTTFSDELREARLARAWGMLQSTTCRNRSIAAIAHDCGFADLSTFNRAVRARFGCTPSDLRGDAGRK